MIYLASPYSHPHPEIVNERVIQTRAATAFFISRGFAIFSPIVHCHELAITANLPTDAEFWWRYNRVMLESARELWVLKLPGHEISLGVNMEIEYANKIKRPVRFQQWPQ